MDCLEYPAVRWTFTSDRLPRAGWQVFLLTASSGIVDAEYLSSGIWMRHADERGPRQILRDHVIAWRRKGR